MAYGHAGRTDLDAALKAAKDPKIKAVVKAAYEAGHADGYMQALHELM